MLLHPRGARDLHLARTQAIAHAFDGRPTTPVRLALASALTALANRLAPELVERPVLRTRTAPN